MRILDLSRRRSAALLLALLPIGLSSPRALAHESTVPTAGSERASVAAALGTATQDSGKGEENKPPEQPGLTEETKHTNQDPTFLFTLLPKKTKAFKELAKKWAIIDFAAREKYYLEQTDQQLEQLKKANPNDPRIAQLEEQRRRIQRDFANMQLLVEVRGDQDQNVRVFATRTTLDKKAGDFVAGFKKQFENWKDVKYLRDEENQTKAEQKKGITRHTLELTAKNQNGKEIWFHLDIMVVLSGSDRNTPWQVTYVHQSPLAKMKNEESLKEAKVLPHLLLWP